MLRSASLSLARRSGALTSIARTQRSLDALEESIAQLACRSLGIALDYRHTAELQSGVRGAIRDLGPVDLVVAWVHDEAGPVPGALVDVALESGEPVQLVQVVGSGAAGPEGSLDGLAKRFEALPQLHYQLVVLGFQRDTAGSRWLTHQEISHGVMAAIDDEHSRYIVGQIEPWALRP
jgi:hypothetical protein